MSRELLVAIHAGAGITGLLVGLTVFPPPKAEGGSQQWWRIAYGGVLAVLVASLLVLIITDWTGLATGARLAFSGLAGLGALMLIRMYMAHRLASSRHRGWERSYVNHVYFTYISLWVGFAIVPALRSPNPGLWIPVAVATVLGAGTLLIHSYQRRIGLRQGASIPLSRAEDRLD